MSLYFAGLGLWMERQRTSGGSEGFQESRFLHKRRNEGSVIGKTSASDVIVRQPPISDQSPDVLPNAGKLQFVLFSFLQHGFLIHNSTILVKWLCMTPFAPIHFCKQNHAIFVMEYARGGDLVWHMNQQDRLSFSEQRSVFYAACIVQGLEFLHRHNIIHRYMTSLLQFWKLSCLKTPKNLHCSSHLSNPKYL